MTNVALLECKVCLQLYDLICFFFVTKKCFFLQKWFVLSVMMEKETVTEMYLNSH